MWVDTSASFVSESSTGQFSFQSDEYTVGLDCHGNGSPGLLELADVGIQRKAKCCRFISSAVDRHIIGSSVGRL